MPSPTLPAAGRRVVAPYITSWSEEVGSPSRLVEVPGRGIAYADESIVDRDSNGVLWHRTPFRPNVGRPMFGQVHPLRQRRAMRRLLCQVCAGPANQTDAGALWLLKDHRDDWPGWPNGMGVTEPPVCLSCVALSTRVCPALREGAVMVRAGRYEIAGVSGPLYTGGPVPTPVGDVVVPFDNPTVRWVRAVAVVRELQDCTLVELDRLPALVEADSCPG